MDLSELLRAPLKKTPQSVVRVYDSYLPVDELDHLHRPVKRTGVLRVIISLEDLGIVRLKDSPQKPMKPANVLKSSPQRSLQKEFDNPKEAPESIIPAKINTKNLMNEKNEEFGKKEDKKEAEYQIIWELEVWKKAEEAKFKAYLKERELDHLEIVTEEWKNNEIEREKQFRNIASSMNQIGRASCRERV